MAYAIISDAQDGAKNGIQHLAMVDRNQVKDSWWTSDDESVIMKFESEEAAGLSRRRLKYNNPMVIDYAEAVSIIREQRGGLDCE